MTSTKEIDDCRWFALCLQQMDNFLWTVGDLGYVVVVGGISVRKALAPALGITWRTSVVN